MRLLYSMCYIYLLMYLVACERILEGRVVSPNLGTYTRFFRGSKKEQAMFDRSRSVRLRVLRDRAEHLCGYFTSLESLQYFTLYRFHAALSLCTRYHGSRLSCLVVIPALARRPSYRKLYLVALFHCKLPVF